MQWCNRCVTPDTRPRVEFANGTCNACLWHDRKQTEIDWTARQAELAKICDQFRRRKGYDCIVPCSGGKDGSYVAFKLRDEYNMHPLCVTFKPQMRTRLGLGNLERFRACGFDHIEIEPDVAAYRKYARNYFISRGMPKQPFVVGISAAVLQEAKRRDIRLIVYGEQGEVEYGGAAETENLQRFTPEFLQRYYYEGQSEPGKYGKWWKTPTAADLKKIHCTWWSYYEDWDPDVHARFAKKSAGLQMMVGGSIGTFTNASQLDDVLQDLHAFCQYIKFGFGRCTSDASIEIRRGRMSRQQGVSVVRMLDGQFPVEYLPHYLDYFEMDRPEFWGVIERHVNRDLLVPTGKPEKPYELRRPCV